MLQSVQPKRAPSTRARADAAMCLYARGDDRAFEELYELLAPRVFRLCISLVGQSDAEELVQEVFLKLHRTRSSFVEGGSVLAWAFAIARTTAVDRSRRRARRPEDAVGAELLESRAPGAEGSPESLCIERALEIAVMGGLERLSEALRTAYLLVRREGLTCAEAGAVLGASTDAVKQRVHRATKELRDGLAAVGW